MKGKTMVEEEIRKGDYTVGLNGVAVVANTFASDFEIALMFGKLEGVEETYKRAFEEWKKDIRYITALALTMNHLGWKYYERNEKIGKKFFEKWHELDAFILDCDYDEETDEEHYKNFTPEEVHYFIRACD